MSIKIMSQVWEHSSHKGSELLLLLAIADNADEQGIAYPSIRYLARKTRMTERNVQYALAKLRKSKELSLTEGAGPHGVHVFQIRGEQFAGGEKFAGEKSAPRGVKGLSPKPSEEEPSVKETPSVSLRSTAPPREKPAKKVARTTKRPKTSMPTAPQEQDALYRRIVDDAFGAWFVAQGLTLALDNEWDAFVRKALANGYQYADWRAAFQNWLTSPYQQPRTPRRVAGDTRLSAKGLRNLQATQRLLAQEARDDDAARPFGFLARPRRAGRDV